MPTISLSHSVMERIQKLNGAYHESKILQDLLPQMGCPVELNDDEKIEIEVFPDRPDLLSHETMAMAVRLFQGLESGEREVGVSSSDVFIDSHSSLNKLGQ